MIHIVTCWTRSPEMLDRIYQSLQTITIPYHWFIVTTRVDLDVSKYQNTTKLIKPDSMPMHTGVNYYYDIVPDTGQWVYVLDDDNIIHPNFSCVGSYIDDTTIDIIVVGQRLEYWEIRCIENIADIAPQKIDNGQFLVRRWAVDTLRYWPIYRGDGYFITEMKILTRERGRGIKLIPVEATYYNAQHWLRP